MTNQEVKKIDREEALRRLNTVLDMITIFTHFNEGLGNHTKQDTQEICDKYKEAHEYIKENLK